MKFTFRYIYSLIRFVFICFITNLIINISYAQEIELTDEERRWVDEHAVIRVAGGSGSPPLQFTRDGEADGFSIDYMKLVAAKAGLTFTFINESTWAHSHNKIKSGDLDLIHSISKNPQRDTYLNFTESYLELPFVYFGRKGSDTINSIDDLMDKKIGVINGWATTQTYEQDFPQLNLIYQPTLIDGLRSVENGSIDVFIIQEPIGHYIIEQYFLSGIEVVGKKFFPTTIKEEFLRLGVRKDWPILYNIINKSIAALTDKELREISNKWLFKNAEDIKLSLEEKNWLLNNKVIRVVADTDAAPIEFIDGEGQISGISGDYLDIIGKKLNVEFEWIQNENVAEGIELIKNSDAEVMSASTPSKGRNQYLDFSKNYLTISTVIFARADSQVFGNLDALAGRTVAQVTGFSITEFIKENYPKIKVVEVDSLIDALTIVNDGKADAFIGSIPSATSIISSEGFVQIMVVGETPYKAYISIGARKNLPLLASSIDKAMNSITDLEHAEISKKWMAMKIEKVENYEAFWKVGIAAIIVFVLILIWNASLRREIKARLDAEVKMRKSQEEALNANKAKSAFLANMSHEIRTPLNAIIGFSEIMQSGMFGKINNEKYVEYINDINQSGNHLSTVINDLLDLSKIEAGKWHLKESNFLLNDCINSSVKMFDGLAVEKNIAISAPDLKQITDLQVYGDVHCIKRIIINLLSNAIKFTDFGGKVKCNVSRETNGDLSIEVEDTGKGIPENRLEHVVNPFDQIQEDQHLNEDGTGLGLSIVKHLIELHGGRLKLMSTIGIGTKAQIILPSKRIVLC